MSVCFDSKNVYTDLPVQLIIKSKLAGKAFQIQTLLLEQRTHIYLLTHEFTTISVCCASVSGSRDAAVFSRQWGLLGSLFVFCVHSTLSVFSQSVIHTCCHFQ